MHPFRACQVSEAVLRFTQRAFEEDPEYIKRPLSKLNAEAVALHKAGNNVAAAAAFAKLFERARLMNLVHAELHVCYRCCTLLAHAQCTQHCYTETFRVLTISGLQQPGSSASGTRDVGRGAEGCRAGTGAV